MNHLDRENGNQMYQVIMEYTDRLREQITPRLETEIQERLLDYNQTQEDIAYWLLAELDLPEESTTSAKRLMTDMIEILLTPEEREDRRLHMQRQNAAKAHEADYDRSACGKKGADIRVKQMRESGLNPAGHALWSDEERSALRTLLEDPANYYKKGKFQGSPNGTILIEKFNAGRNGSSKPATSIRAQYRRILKEIRKEKLHDTKEQSPPTHDGISPTELKGSVL